MIKRKSLITWAVVVTVMGLIITLGIIGAQSSTHSGQIPGLGADDHVRGSRQAAVQLVEYSDFQCPACGAFEPLVAQVSKYYGDKVAVVYREFPLRQTHRYAQLAAQAAEAAAEQNKFWEYHDLLFARQKSWAGAINVDPVFRSYATELGLDEEQFVADYNSQKVIDRIDQDVRSGTNANIPGTPTFFLNGKRISPQSFNDFKKLIDQQLP